jgi:NADPH:quinone reductase-like Zn-dependent oxidoreductase
VGDKVTGFRPGDRVFGRVRGGFAEYAPMFEHQAMRLPPRLTWEEAAAIPVSFITAYEMLYPPYGNLRAGEWLLVAGASSGTGVASIQTAKAIGAHTIGTSGSAEKLARLRTAGLDVAIKTRGADFAAQVREATGGRGADLIVNFIGGSVFAECLSCLARHGRLGIVGYLDGVMEARIDLATVHANRHVIFGISNAKLVPEERAQAARGFARDVLPAVVDGRITPLVGRIFEFDELPAAKACMESSGTVGKIVVRGT